MEEELADKIRSLEERLAELEKKPGQLTMVLFSGEFDLAMAAFIIANGALAMGKEVTIFVTFWGFDIIKRPDLRLKGKGFLEKMVLWMRPKGATNLATTRMNFGGIGPRLFDYMMKKKNIQSLRSLIDTSLELGVRIIACSTTMALMGLDKEDLIEGVEIGGVVTFLGSAYDSQTTLFL